MNPYTKGAVFILRLASLGVIVISLILLFPHLLAKLTRKKVEGDAGFFYLLLKLLALGGGVWLLKNSRRIAKNWTEDLEG